MKNQTVRIPKPANPYDPAWTLYNEQNPGIYKGVGAEAEGEGGSTAPDPDNPDIKAMIEKAVAEATGGLRKNRDELLAEKKSLSERAKMIDSLGGEEGIKQLQGLRQMMDQDEDMKLFSSGKREEYNKRIVGRMKEDYEKQLQGRDGRINELEETSKQLENRLSRLVIDGQIREAANKAGVFPSAIDDALFRGRQVFSLSEEGAPVARDEQGGMINGKDGKPLTVAEWVGSMKEVASHWWPTPSGSGAMGGKFAGQVSEKQKLQQQYNDLMAKGKVSEAIAIKNQLFQRIADME